MNIKKMTIWFIILIIVLIAGYDVFAIYKGGTEASISQRLIIWSYDYPAFTFLFGFAMGHLFWRLKDNSETAKINAKMEQDGK